MSLFNDLQSALQVKLNSLANRPYIAWPNVDFTPISGKTYLRPTLLPAKSTLSTLDGMQRNSGLYQIDIFTPAGIGSGAALSLADTIKDHFNESTELTANDTIVYIQAISISAPSREEAWYRVYVQIDYIVYQ